MARGILSRTLLWIEKRVFINWRMFWIVWFWQRYFHFIQFGCIAVDDWCWRRKFMCWWDVGDDRYRQHLKDAKIEILSPTSKNHQQPWNRHIPCHQYHCSIQLLQWCWWLFFSDVGDSIFQYRCYKNQLIEWIPFCNSSAELVWPSEQRMSPRNVNKVKSIKNGDNNT